MDAASAVTVILTSAVKLLFASPVSYALGHTVAQTILLVAIGACIGVLVFFFSARYVLAAFRRRYLRRRAQRAARGLPPKPIFTRTNRGIIRLKQGYGFWGIAAVGPPIISIPIAAVLAAKYFKHDRRTLPTMLVAVVAWAFILGGVFSFMR